MANMIELPALSAKEIVEGLTVKQRTVALIGFVEALLQLDDDETTDAEAKRDRFAKRLRKAAEATERMLSEVPG